MKMKRILSIILTLCMIVSTASGITPSESFAAQVQPMYNEGAAVENNDISIEGTNGFGHLLSEEILSHNQTMTEGASAGYIITGLEIEGNMATVTFDSMEEATLVVALYTEDGQEMLLSGQKDVLPEETQTTVTLDGDMPEYFLASAYLLDKYDLSPLCQAYDTPLYTKEMQELLESTVDDYDADRILNLDEDKTSNFAVYAEQTLVIEPVAGINTVVSTDDDSHTYVIENADSTITGLQNGDVFVYPYADEEILVVKVSTVTVDGTRAVIYGEDLTLEEVFSHIKIDGMANTADAEVDTSVANDGVTYQGMYEEDADDPNEPARRADGEASIARKMKFDLNIKSWKGKTIEFNGIFECTIKVGLEYYITPSYQSLGFRVDSCIEYTGEIKLENEFAKIDITLLKAKYPIFAGLAIGVEPTLVLKGEASASLSLKWEATVGFSFTRDSRGWRFKNLSKKGTSSAEVKLEGKLFFGIDFKPGCNLLASLAATEIESEIGFEITGEIDVLGDDDIKHDCFGCFDGKISLVMSITPSVKFLKNENLKFSVNIANFKWDLGDFYFCLQHLDLGWGICPHKSFQVAISAVDAQGNPVADAPIVVDGNELGKTNINGVFVAYFPEGNYTFSSVIDGSIASQTIYVFEPASYKLRVGGIAAPENMDIDFVFLLEGGIVATGECGDNTYWRLYGNGVLYISGTGDISSNPWQDYTEQIKGIYIANGVTGIGRRVFQGCDNLRVVSVPGSASWIGYGAFDGCTSLEYLSLSEGIEGFDYYAFNNCSSLKNVTIPNSVKEIKYHAFAYCKSMETVRFGSQCEASIGEGAFQHCTSLAELELGEKITAIGRHAFYVCDSLRAVNIPGSVSWIGYGAFDGCTSLEYLSLSEGIEGFDYYAFNNCSSLKNVTIPNSVKEIKYHAFAYCSDMGTIVFTGNAPVIGSRAFTGVTATVYYPAGNGSWTPDLRQDYGGTLTWIAHSALAAAKHNTTVVVTDKFEHQLPVAYAAFTGEHNTITENETVLQEAAYTGLVPGEQYVLIAARNPEETELLEPGNLLYIDQGVASEDGTLVFRYCLPEGVIYSYVTVCGASNQNLADAEVSFPEMVANSEVQVIAPTVTYHGTELVEQRDYILLGDVIYTQAGTYDCYIRGINQYSGLVALQYTVRTEGVTVGGNVESYLTDGDVTVELVCEGEVVYSTVVSGKTAEYAMDGVVAGSYTLRISKENHVTQEIEIVVGEETVVQDVVICPVGDVTGDGVVNIKDFQRLLRHVNKTAPLTDYALSCGDVTDDDACNIKDFQRLLRHVNKSKPLF